MSPSLGCRSALLVFHYGMYIESIFLSENNVLNIQAQQMRYEMSWIFFQLWFVQSSVSNKLLLKLHRNLWLCKNP